MADERVELWPRLGRINGGNSLSIGGITGEAINRLGRQGKQSALFQLFGASGNRFCGGRIYGHTKLPL